MSARSIIVTFAISVAVVAYLFYAMVPVPANLEQKDELFWIFAKRKCIRGASMIGEFLGFGNQAQLNRQLTSARLFAMDKAVNYDRVKIRTDKFDGVSVRIYEPDGMGRESPGLIWIHGGGWVIGSAEADDFITTELSRRLGILIVSIDYRLAPEFPFPMPFDDCVRATVHFLNHAKEMGVDPTRVVIAGASAGGNLAAAVSLKLRDIGHVPRPSIQVLYVPCLQAVEFKTPSYQSEANNAFLPRYWMANYWLWYGRSFEGHRLSGALVENQHTSPEAKISVASQLVDHRLIPQKYVDAAFVPDTVDHGNETLWKELQSLLLDPYYAPLMATNLKNLPAAYIVTAEYDVLRDDGIIYARRLSNDGVPVVHRHYDKGYHALLSDFTKFSLANDVLGDLVQFLTTHL